MNNWFRSFLITYGIAAYAWLFPESEPAPLFMLGSGIALQIAVLCIRRWVSPLLMPKALYVAGLLADGVTVFLFALATYGGIARRAYEI